MINKLLAENTGNIVILSGEGNEGSFELFTGKRTALAVDRKLTKESCNGDRWAKAFIYLHDNDGGKVYMDLHSGDMRHIDDDDID